MILDFRLLPLVRALNYHCIGELEGTFSIFHFQLFTHKSCLAVVIIFLDVDIGFDEFAGAGQGEFQVFDLFPSG